MSKTDDDAAAFIRALEEQNGGRLEWKSYAFYMGTSGYNDSVTLGGLIYVVAGKLVFEDFEKENPLSRLIGRKKEYQKFKIEAPLSSIRELRSVSASDAKRTIRGKTEAAELSVLTGLRKIIERRSEAVIFDDGSAWFFEMYETEGLREKIEEEHIQRGTE